MTHTLGKILLETHKPGRHMLPRMSKEVSPPRADGILEVEFPKLNLCEIIGTKGFGLSLVVDFINFGNHVLVFQCKHANFVN